MAASRVKSGKKSAKVGKKRPKCDKLLKQVAKQWQQWVKWGKVVLNNKKGWVEKWVEKVVKIGLQYLAE